MKLLIALGLVGFVLLGIAAVEGWTAGFDSAVRGALQVLAFPALTAALRILTWAGSAAVLIPVVVLLSWRWSREGRRRAAMILCLCYLGSFAIEVSTKYIFRRPRPTPFFGIEAPESFSYPSGHALNSSAVCLAVALSMPKGRRRGAVAGAVLATGFIGFTRAYLGVHYPTDVIGGWLAGTAWAVPFVRRFGSTECQPGTS